MVNPFSLLQERTDELMLSGASIPLKHKFVPQDCRLTEAGKEGTKKQGDITHQVWVLKVFGEVDFCLELSVEEEMWKRRCCSWMDIYSVLLLLIQNKITSWKLSWNFVSKDGY